MKKKTPAKQSPTTQQINELKAAINKFCDLLDDEIFPISQELSEAAAYARMLAVRGQGRIPDKERIDAIHNLKGQGKNVAELARETGSPVSTVRLYYGPSRKKTS